MCLRFPLRPLHPLFSLGLGLDVALHEELSEQHEQGQNIHNVCDDNPEASARALCRDQICALRHHGNELDHLHHGEARLPPDGQRLARHGVLGVHADEVVRVHDRVDEAVQDNGKVNVTVVVDVSVEPVEQEDGDVMVYVQEAELPPLLANHDKNGVPEVPDFANVEKPQQVSEGRVPLVVPDAGQGRVAVAVRKHESLDGHVGAEHDLTDIVDELDRIGVHGWHAELHDCRSKNDEEKVRQSNVERRRKVGQWPSLVVQQATTVDS